MNNEFNVEFFAYFVMFLVSIFLITSVWVMYDLDRDDSKKLGHKAKKIKLKKA